MNILSVKDFSFKNKVNPYVYALIDKNGKIPSRLLKFDSKPKELSYITVFNHKHHIAIFQNSEYIIDKKYIYDLIPDTKLLNSDILLIDDFICDLDSKQTLFNAITIDTTSNILNSHIIIYDNFII
jgi:hypothetical protein